MQSKLLRYQTVLEFLDDGPRPLNDILENLEEDYPRGQIMNVLDQMKNKEYINVQGNLVKKQKDLEI